MGGTGGGSAVGAQGFLSRFGATSLLSTEDSFSSHCLQAPGPERCSVGFHSGVLDKGYFPLIKGYPL